VIAVPPKAAAGAIDAFDRFGKGRHPAGLNFGDCFAYACARSYRMPLLFKGNDFPLTDIQPG
jgi:ribonuclease VapC